MPYGDFMRASPIKSVSVMAGNNSRDGLRRSLFASQTTNKGDIKDLRDDIDRMTEKPRAVDEFADLLNSLEKVQVGGGRTQDHEQDRYQMTPEEKVADTNSENRSREKLLAPNILHPTTKTFASHLSQNITQTITQTHQDPATKSPNILEKPTSCQQAEPPSQNTKIPNKNIPHQPKHRENSTEIGKTAPKLIPIDDLIAIVNQKTPFTNTSYSHTSRYSTQDTTSKLDHITNHHTNKNPDQKPTRPIIPNNQSSHSSENPKIKTKEQSARSVRKQKTWCRTALKTPKKEGEQVVMGKRLRDIDCTTPSIDISNGKRSKQGMQSTIEETAVAVNQPRRAS